MGASTEECCCTSPNSLSLSPTLSTSASARSKVFGQGDADGRDPVLLLDRQLPKGAWWLEWRVWLSWLAGRDRAGFCRLVVCWYEPTFS